MYIVPVLLEHFDNPTDTTKAILLEANVDIEEARKIRHLLEYHKNFLTNGKPDYPLLRIGLSEYFDNYLSGIFHQLGLAYEQTSFLDYCGGNGQYTKVFLNQNRQSLAVLVDKDTSGVKLSSKRLKLMNIDFENNPTWYKPFKENFGVILLSEILHCKSPFWQQYLIKSSCEMLAKGGKLIINENVDHCMRYRISKLKGEDRPLVTGSVIQNLVDGYPLKQIDLIYNNNHHVFCYEKI